MTMYMHRWAAAADPYRTAPQKPGRKRWFDVRFIDLVRPDGYWPQPYTLEQAFEIFRWMVAKGAGYSTQERWGSRGVVDLLGATSGIGHSSVIPVSSLDDLRKRFHYAVLGMVQCESQVRWRADFDIGPSGKARLAVPVYRPFAGARHLGFASEAAIHEAFETLTTGHRGHVMAVPLNYIHLGSRYLHGVSVGVYPKQFRFSLIFGDDPVERCASRWDETIAVTRPGKTFLDTLARARDVFNVIVLGADSGCDAADLMGSCQYHPAWHREHVAAFARGERPELPATQGGRLVSAIPTPSAASEIEGGREP